MKKCRKCCDDFDPTLVQMEKSDYICTPCKRVKERLYRQKRKKQGNPIKCARPNFEHRQAYEKRPERSSLQRLRQTLRNAVKCGKVKKSPCEVCGDNNSEAHHDDYSKPLEVRWLCKIHHASIHKKFLVGSRNAGGVLVSPASIRPATQGG